MVPEVLEGLLVFWMLIILFVSLVAAGTVLVYVLYPHRDEEVPYAPWLGAAMRKGVEALPTIDNQEHSARR